MKMKIFTKAPYIGLIINFVYAIANCVIGFATPSWWFITVGVYYVILSLTRCYIRGVTRKLKDNRKAQEAVRRNTGILLVLLSFCIVGMNVLSAIKERGTTFHEIIMITIATYTFTKITIAIIGMVKIKHSNSPASATLRNISLADACVSILTMQRSMLQSFPGMATNEIRIFNILTGTAIWFIVMLLGINLLRSSRKY